ncbi:MAG: tetratricopeptide repeat protein [Nitrospinota bacterium]|nr:tetratricopeptide repeat protein [Nitrospinota bacterium]
MDCKLRVKIALVVGLLVLFEEFYVYADQTDSHIQEGLNQYEKGLYQEAEKSFAQASSNRPDDHRLDYNLGSSQYKQGKYLEALQDYTQAVQQKSNPQIKINSLYNSGNALFKLGKLEEAEAVYKKVLTLDSSDMDAKFNLEYVRAQIKKKKDQEKENNKGDASNQEKKESQNQKDNNGENKPQSNESPSGQKEPQKNNPKESAKANPRELNEEEAVQLLKNLSEDLKKISRMQAAKDKSKKAYQGNQW